MKPKEYGTNFPEPRVAVLQVIQGLGVNLGGLSHCVPSLCSGVSALGVQVSIAFLYHGEKLPMEVETLGQAGVLSYPFSSRKFHRKLWALVGQNDLVHVNGLWTYFTVLACVFAKLQGKTLVISPHGMLGPRALANKRLKKVIASWLYQKKVLKSADLLHATSAMEVEHFKEFRLDGAVAVIANGVTIPAQKLEPGSATPAKPTSLRDNRRRLLFLARIHPIKGVLELVKAVASLRDVFEREDWILTIAGPDEGGHLAVVQNQIRELKVDSLIEFLGVVEGEDKWNLYRSAELFILPSYSENFGLVVAEALGCSVPVITTQATPWSELLERRCGWWYSIGPQALEHALKEAMLMDPSELSSMGERGKHLVQEKYGWDSVSLEFKSAYFRLLGRENHFLAGLDRPT